jgi:predicted transposase YbfD/YdcC
MKEESCNFLDYFQDIKDPRIDRKKLYPIEEIFLVTICGVICGSEGWSDLWLFGKRKLDYLRKVLPFKNGIPTDDTFRRFFRSLDPQEFQDRFLAWVKSLQKHNPKFVAIDGKTVRRSYDKGENKGAIHMVSAWCSEQGVVLGQCKTEEKSNEITAIPELLDLLSIKESIVTIDAMGCQRKIADKIIAKGADYILAVKDNQKNLHNEITRFFNRHKSLDFKGRGYEFQHYEETEKGHGRIEIRKYTVIDKTSWMDQRDFWSGLNSICMVESRRMIGDITSKETRYYISSLAADAEKFAKAIRSHWGVENCLHWVLDVVFYEDQLRIRKGYAPQNISIVKHISLNLLRQAKNSFKGVSIKALRKVAGWDNTALDAILATNFNAVALV